MYFLPTCNFYNKINKIMEVYSLTFFLKKKINQHLLERII